MPFRFTYDGDTWRTEELLGVEVEQLEDRLNVSYGMLQPWTRIKHRLAILTVFLARTRTEDEVAKIIGTLDLDQLEKMIEYIEDDGLPAEYVDGVPDPKAPATTSTSGSGTWTGPGSGLPTSPDVNDSAT